MALRHIAVAHFRVWQSVVGLQEIAMPCAIIFRQPEIPDPFVFQCENHVSLRNSGLRRDQYLWRCLWATKSDNQQGERMQRQSTTGQHPVALCPSLSFSQVLPRSLRGLIALTASMPQDALMLHFATRAIAEEPDVEAPDGADVRLLATASRGSMAHFELAEGEVSKAMMHKTVEELWFITAGEGEMWRKNAQSEEVTALHPGLSLSIPVGTHFQFRSLGEEPLEAVAVTMPPWPGDDEAVAVPGKWPDSAQESALP
jgi:mannose-6-phosphate isomerase-like protein (cupin superfamily)